ncbi:hypothetical protein [Hellea balneolensis]|uniref:hypothetical protein n=1 Tax=Hellea balneolensis TaxID=287478 RepID=UPI0003FABB6C|nr:hypothetical protein [Hellea balneolensis]
MKAKPLHRATALILGLFILTHLAVHLFALGGIEAHLKALDAVQWIYRNPLGETLLVIAILTQIVTGLKRLKAKRKNKTFWAKAQVLSGLYLMGFLIIHTGAAIFTHSVFGLETDFYWAAGSMNISPIKFFFWPYYFFAVLSFFVHFACALHFGWPGKFGRVKKTLPWLGGLIALTIILTFTGAFYDVPVTEDVLNYYRKNFGILGVE